MRGIGELTEAAEDIITTLESLSFNGPLNTFNRFRHDTTEQEMWRSLRRDVDMIERYGCDKNGGFIQDSLMDEVISKMQAGVDYFDDTNVTNPYIFKDSQQNQCGRLVAMKEILGQFKDVVTSGSLELHHKMCEESDYRRQAEEEVHQSLLDNARSNLDKAKENIRELEGKLRQSVANETSAEDRYNRALEDCEMMAQEMWHWKKHENCVKN